MPPTSDLDPQLQSELADRFATHALRAAKLPTARASDLRESCDISACGGVLRLTCDITGSTHETPWDGSEEAAFSLIDEAAEDTAHLVTRTPRYAWMRSGR